MKQRLDLIHKGVSLGGAKDEMSQYLLDPSISPSCYNTVPVDNIYVPPSVIEENGVVIFRPKSLTVTVQLPPGGCTILLPPTFAAPSISRTDLLFVFILSVCPRRTAAPNERRYISIYLGAHAKAQGLLADVYKLRKRRHENQSRV